MSFCNNEINIEGQPTYTDHFIYVKGVYQFIFNKNTFNLAQGVRFSDAEGKQQGVLLTSIRTEEDSRTFTIDTANTDRKIVIRQGGTVLSTVTTTEAVTLSVVAEEGGDLVLSTDDAGNLYIDIVCKDGYRYAGMLISGTQKVPETLTLSKNASIIVSLTK